MTDIGRVGMVIKGNYNPASTYEALDAVSDSQGLYVAKQNVPANTPLTNTTYWQQAIVKNAPYHDPEVLATLTASDTTVMLAATKTGWITIKAPLSGLGARTIICNIEDADSGYENCFGTSFYAVIANYAGGFVGAIPCIAGHTYKINISGHDSNGLQVYIFES